MPRDGGWMPAMAHLAEVCAFLGDGRRATMLYDLLIPYAPYHVAISNAVWNGAVTYYLGLLARTMQRWEPASKHFTAALEMHRGLGAALFLAHTQYEYARMLLARGQAGDRIRAQELLRTAAVTAQELGMKSLTERVQAVMTGGGGRPAESGTEGLPQAAIRNRPSGIEAMLRREGPYWTLAFAGTVSRLKDSRGLQYLVQLLRRPGQEHLALDLGQGPSASGRASGSGDGGPVLDSQARAEYRKRLEEVREELAEAEEHHDLGRAEAAQAEMEFISRELAAAVGLGGSARAIGSDAERARSTVTKGIKSAIAAIRAADPGAGRHLGRSIRTGYVCVYQPDPEERVTWQV